MRRKEDNVKILFAGRYSEEKILSGPERTSKDIFDEYASNHSAVFLQYFFDGRKFSLFKKLFGKQTTEYGIGKVFTLGIFRIIPFLVSYRPEIIHLLNYERFAVILYLYSLVFKTAVIYSSHGIIKFENTAIKKQRGRKIYKDNFCERIFIRYSDKIIFPSEEAKNTAGKYYKLPEEKTVIIPNIAGGLFYDIAKINSESLPIKAVIYYKNSLNKSGYEMLLGTLNLLKSGTEIYLLTNELTDFQHGKFLNLYVQVMMPQDKLAEFYADKNVFLSLNSYDTFSISTAEAMASGLIPIVTNETGISAYINNGVNGFKIAYGDTSILGEILDRISSMNSNEIISLSQKTKKTAEAFRIDKIFSRYTELYRECVK